MVSEEIKEREGDLPAPTEGGGPGPYDHLHGVDLFPGALGWLELDEFGIPTGSLATLEPAPPPALACRVKSTSTPHPAHLSWLTTPAGAELIAPLNPNGDFRAYEAGSFIPLEMREKAKRERLAEWERRRRLAIPRPTN